MSVCWWGALEKQGQRQSQMLHKDKLGVEKVHFNDDDDEVTGPKIATRPRAAPRCRIKVTLFSMP